MVAVAIALVVAGLAVIVGTSLLLRAGDGRDRATAWIQLAGYGLLVLAFGMATSSNPAMVARIAARPWPTWAEPAFSMLLGISALLRPQSVARFQASLASKEKAESVYHRQILMARVVGTVFTIYGLVGVIRALLASW